jgi:glycosyltransferase involved in cell wall biosynthesis
MVNKKIGLDLRLYGTEHGGIGRYVSELFPRILDIDTENEYILFGNAKNFAPEHIANLQKKPNVKFVHTKTRHYSFGEQVGFLRLLNKFNLDLVHFPNFNYPIFYQKPFVVTIHDMVHHKISGAKKSRYLHFMTYKKVIQSSALKSQKVITVSNASKNDIHSLLGVPKEKIQVIYEGVSLKTDIEESEVERVKNNYVISRPYLLFVGVLERKKNIVNLTRGFDAFLQKYKSNIDLVIVGKTDKHYPEIKHQALDIKNRGRLIFTGPVEDGELRALYKGAYAFITASLHEGFGLPGVEALSFGLPLLTSNISVFNEIYDNAAIYFNGQDPADIAEKINLLVRDNQFYEQLQKKSFERSLMFDWDNCAKETLGVYGQVTGDAVPRI